MAETQFTEVSPEYWQKRWEEREIGFHRSHVDLLLEKHLDKLVDGRQNIKVFFPLCGKALDMKCLWERGHTIVGVEAARTALEEFFEEHSIKYAVTELPDGLGSLLTSEDNRIKLYCCDLFKFNSDLEGSMNAVWDRGSLVAINKEDRQRYVKLVTSLLAPDCRYLVETLEFDETKYPGPPFYVSEQQFYDLFGEKFNITKLDKRDSFEERHRSWGLDSLYESLYLTTLKN